MRNVLRRRLALAIYRNLNPVDASVGNLDDLATHVQAIHLAAADAALDAVEAARRTRRNA